MSPPRVSFADKVAEQRFPEQQSAAEIAALIAEFLAQHVEAAVLEDGKVVFDMRVAKHALSTEYDRCTLHLWSEERNLVRRIVAVTERAGSLRLATQRFGDAHTKLLELVATREQRTPTARDTARTRYVRVVQRVLVRAFPDWTCEGFRTAMDLEKSFGPAYARGSMVRGNQAWAVIGVNENETATTVDGILTLGILWLHDCRERAGGRRLYQGLRIVVPQGTAGLTLSRMAWLNGDAAQWELWELAQSAEELTQRDAADQGNLRTRLIHHPDEQAASERFAAAVRGVMALVPTGEEDRVEQRLRSTAELAFLLHGMEFARARIVFAPNSFAQAVEITVGVGAGETLLGEGNHAELAELVAELFARRRAMEATGRFARRGDVGAERRIGAPMTAPAHARMTVPRGGGGVQRDPLYRAAPERWLESMLRRDLGPLTRGLAGQQTAARRGREGFANEVDPDSIGNRADSPSSTRDAGPSPTHASKQRTLAGDPGAAQDDNFLGVESRVIPRLDPRHVYAQVPAIAGASDRGLLDLLGVTADGRLAVIELKADEDLHFALQGLDYWTRVRHHHLQTADVVSGLGEFQRHGYFGGVELSPLTPRLYLVAPALRIHPATEVVLRYLSPRVEWHLLALDERWRSQVRVVWRKSGGRG
jgi:hypothetical protein